MRHRGEKEIRINTHTQYDLTNESNENSDSDFIIIIFSENRLESLKSQA